MAKETGEKEEKTGYPKKILAARLVVFAVTITWVLGWLMTGLVLHPILFDPFSGLLGFRSLPEALATFLSIWFIATFLVVGALVAVRGFRFVGRWERE